MKDELWTTHSTDWKYGGEYQVFFGNFVLIYILDMGMTGNIEKSDIFGMNNFIAYQMETFFSCFFGNAIQKMLVCRSTVVTFLKR